jgi:glycosyltransferase involved in cell wall biosynthesis
VKKILILTSGSYVFGTEKVLLQLLSGLKSNYHFHCLVNGWNDGRFISRLIDLNIPYTTHKLGWIFKTKLSWTLDSLMNYPYALFKFLKLNLTEKFDLFYTTSFRPVIFLYPFINKKIIYHVHEINSNSRVNCFFIKLINRKVTKYIAVSNFIANDLQLIGICKNKIEIIYNGVDVISKNTLKNNVHDKVLIGIVGQISHHKGHEILIEAFNSLLRKYNNIYLVIVGSGNEEYIAHIKKILLNYGISDHVIWRGYLTSIDAIYNKIDILCLPTIIPEPFGLVVCEAAINNIPVVVSNLGGVVEMIEDEITGLLFENSNYIDLAQKLEKLIVDTKFRVDMGSNAKQHISKKFSETLFLNKINNLIHSVLEK